MVSKNKLLGRKVKEEKAVKVKVDKDLGWPKRLYSKSNKAGKVFQTKAEQEEQFKLGWVESPADLLKPIVEPEPEPEPVKEKESKIDVSSMNVKNKG